MWAWGYPCHRNWTAIITLFNLQKGQTSLVTSLKKRDTSELHSLKVKDISLEESNVAMMIPIELNYSFSKEGSYEVIMSFRDFSGKLRIPFELRTREWPIFTDEERKFAEHNPKVVRSIRATVHCEQCEHAYIFEESVLDRDIPGGVFRFPSSGIFECVECGYELNLLDLQGQVRASLKKIMKQSMEGSKNVLSTS
jgi:hypothetical protein